MYKSSLSVKHLIYFFTEGAYECMSMPCMNGASCVDLESGGHTCNCLEGYEGDTCSGTYQPFFQFTLLNL